MMEAVEEKTIRNKEQRNEIQKKYKNQNDCLNGHCPKKIENR